MIINALKKSIGVFRREQATEVNWPSITEDKVECSIDETPIDCEELQETYTGIPAPEYLEDDPWFGPAPVRSEKQLDYMEKETQIKKEEEEKHKKEYNGEPCGMHQLMYEMATSNWNTVQETQGGSENIQEGPGGWNSGNGWSPFRK